MVNCGYVILASISQLLLMMLQLPGLILAKTHIEQAIKEHKHAHTETDLSISTLDHSVVSKKFGCSWNLIQCLSHLELGG